MKVLGINDRHSERASIRRMRMICLIGVFGAFGAVQGHATSLSALLGGASLTCGDKTFTDFSGFNSDAGGGAIAPDASGVFITAIDCNTDNPGIMIQSGMWNVNANQSMDTAFSYAVISSGGPIVDASLADLSFGATGSGNSGGDIHITESVFDSSNNNLGNLLTDYQLGITSDTINFGPESEVFVNKDISLEGNSAGSAVLSTLTQNFSEVPEPGTLSMLSLALIGGALGSLRQRKF